MSQSASLIRVAKHALDGTPVYPHQTPNTIYYQPVDFSAPSTKYLAYAIQRPTEHLVPVGNHPVKKEISPFFICISQITSRERERKRMHLTVFTPSSDLILQASFCLFCLMRRDTASGINEEEDHQGIARRNVLSL